MTVAELLYHPRVVPGSHKANVSLPAEWRDVSAVGGGAMGGPPNLRRVPATAGTAIIFTEVRTDEGDAVILPRLVCF